MDSTSRPIRNVQALRAIAALLVVCAHLNKLLPDIGIRPFGFGGVDVFFVISGFIMVYTTQSRKVSPAAFMANRVARIVPIYWVITLAVFTLALVAPSLLQNTVSDPFQLAKSLFFVPFSRRDGVIAPLLSVGWTLNYEMFFYLLFACGLAFSRYLAGVLATGLVLLGLVVFGMIARPQGIIPAFYTNPGMLEFALGMVIALSAGRMPSGASGGAKLLVGGLIGLALVVIVVAPGMMPALPYLLICGVPAIIVVGGAVLLEKWGLGIRSRLLYTLGNASYSIYLTHPFVTVGVQNVAVKLQVHNALSVAFIAITFAGVCGIGLIVHYCLERPLADVARRIFSARRLRPQPTALGATGIDNIGVALEDSVAQMVLAHELPEVVDGSRKNPGVMPRG